MTYVQQSVNLIGDKGMYQKILMGFLILCYIELGLMLFGSTFVFMNPEFTCPGYDNPSEEEACPIIDQCTIGTHHKRQIILTLLLSMGSSTVTVRHREISFNLQSI